MVSLENEDYTTKMSWYTGKAYEKVYKKHDSAGKEFLYHTPAKRAPFVGRNEDVEAVLRRIAETKSKASVDMAPLAEAIDARKVRHISVRGLWRIAPCDLWSPAVLPRKTHVEYFDRDQSSARAIAGLRCIKLSGLGRPSAFRCPRAKAQILTVVR